MLRLTWLIQAASGSAVIPAISTRRVDSSMKKSTANRVRPRLVQTLTVKKVGGGEDVPVGFQELCPGRLLQTLRRGFQAVVAEDVGDRASADLMIEGWPA